MNQERMEELRAAGLRRIAEHLRGETLREADEITRTAKQDRRPRKRRPMNQFEGCGSPAQHLQAVPAAWSEAMRGWVTWYEVREVSPRTIALRTYHVRRLATWTGAPTPFELGPKALVDFLGSHKWDVETRRSVRSSIKSFYDWAHGAGLTTANLAVSLPQIKQPDPRPRPVDSDDYERAVANSDRRTALMIRIAGTLGLRRAEVAAIHSRDISHEGTGLTLTVHGKGAKTRKVPLPQTLGEDLQNWIESQGGKWAFPSPQTDGHMTAHWVGTMVARALPEGFTMHKLRHRALTRAYRHGKDIHLVMTLAGHTNVATTSRYYLEPDDAALRATLEAMSE
jgi:integrase